MCYPSILTKSTIWINYIITLFLSSILTFETMTGTVFFQILMTIRFFWIIVAVRWVQVTELT